MWFRSGVVHGTRTAESWLGRLVAGDGGSAPTPVERDVLRRHGNLMTSDALHETGNEKNRRDIEIRSVALQDALARARVVS